MNEGVMRGAGRMRRAGQAGRVMHNRRMPAANLASYDWPFFSMTREGLSLEQSIQARDVNRFRQKSFNDVVLRFEVGIS